MKKAECRDAICAEIARLIGEEAGLRFVYTGNIWGDQGENTLCPACGKLLVERRGFSVKTNLLKRGACPACAAPVSGVWQ